MSSNRMPDFIVIGAMKAGTTSLFHYLEQHPQISGSSIKEPSFFAHTMWDKGLNWYQDLFPDNDNLKFEASTNYTKYPSFDNVPERIHSLLPDVKLIYVVRHPVDRAISQLHHLIVHKHVSRSAPLHTVEFWNTRGSQCIELSQYHTQLSQYLRYFSISQICVVRFEDFISDISSTLNDLLKFVGLEATFYNDDSKYEQHNVLTKRPQLKWQGLPGKIISTARHSNIAVLRRLLEVPVPKPELTPEIQQWIWDQVSDDLAEFEALTGRNLDYHAPL